MKRVLIVQRVLPHYRVPFFDALRAELSRRHIELILAVGQPSTREATKKEGVTLPWAQKITNRYVRVGRGRSLVWQPATRWLGEVDLVIVEQASRLLLNYRLMACRRIRRRKLAFWGHGENLDRQSAAWMAEAVKRATIRQCDWWFAYTESAKDLVVMAGFPGDRVTSVQNSIDTEALISARLSVSPESRRDLSQCLSLTSDNVAIFIGSLYAAKRLRFLVEAADLIRSQVQDFQLVVVGDGPDRTLLEGLAMQRPWLHVVGQLVGQPLANLASLAQLLLMPGLVGLAVLDSFALELPMVTTAIDYHSPEVTYLVDGFNGAVVNEWSSAKAFADRVVALLQDRDELDRLRTGCRSSVSMYTVGAMAERFADGIERVLAI